MAAMEAIAMAQLAGFRCFSYVENGGDVPLGKVVRYFLRS